jgi:hypothetical protein
MPASSSRGPSRGGATGVYCLAGVDLPVDEGD